MKSRVCVSAAWVGPVLMVCGLSGCENRSATDTGELAGSHTTKGYIAVIGAGPDDPLWPIIQASAGQHVGLDSRLGTRFLSPANSSPKAQADLLKSLNDPDLRGICIHILAPEAVAPALRRLRTAGLPVVSMIAPAPQEVRVGHVGFDEIEVGHELARCVAEALGNQGGTIMVLHAGYEHPAYGGRYMAFTEGMKAVEAVDVLGEFNCAADPLQARRIIQERSARYPRLTAWVAMGDWALEDGHPVDELFGPGQQYITVGALPRHWPLIRKGIIPCVVGADYSDLGSQALELCEAALRDPRRSNQVIYVPLRQVTPANLDQYIRDWQDWSDKNK